MPESPPSVEAVAAYLEKIHIFRGIPEDYLFAISERLDDKRLQAGEVVLETNQRAESFYIIYAGKVDVTREEKGQRKSRFSAGDYFGMDVFFEDAKRDTKITATEDTLLLELPGNLFAEIPDAIDFLRDQLGAFLKCRELLETVNFEWLGENEAIYFIVNKHPILFWRRAPLPFILTLSSPVVFFWGMWVGSLIALITSVMAFVIGLVWLIWNWLDWGNDYYIVTNQRVIWLEKIIGIFDSRQEANLAEVKSIDAQTDVVVQSVFDYGHVKVNTIFGGVALDFTPYPTQAKLLIEELWQRSKRDEEKRAKDRLRKAIVEQIEAARAVEEKRRKPVINSEVQQPKAVFGQKVLPKKKKKKKTKLFTLRYEEGKEIVYRKHIVVLFKKIIPPAILTVVLGFYILYQIYLLVFLKSPDALRVSYIFLLSVGLLTVFGWLYYQYLDWSNDIFKVSEDKIFDIDRKPFGDIQSRSSELKNIESTEYQRTGLISVIFNYGTVYIHIGSEEFEFEDVLDPAAVQQDINHRYNAIQEKARLAQEKRERNEMIKWLVAYHESSDEIEDMINKINEIQSRKVSNENDEEAE